MPQAATTARSPQLTPIPEAVGPNAASSESKRGLTGKTPAIVFIQSGMLSAGTKIPDMNSSGSTITLAIGGAAFSDGTSEAAANPSAASESVPTSTLTTTPGSVESGRSTP